MLKSRQWVITLLAGLGLASVSAAESLYFIRGNIHTEIVLPTTSIRSITPALVEHVETPLVAVGWGDRDFFGSKKRLLTTLKALFLPTSATIRLAPMDAAGLRELPAVETFKVSDEELAELAQFIAEVGGDAHIHKRQEGAVYFSAKGTYFLLNTCNNWTGRALNRSGLEVAAWRAWFAGGLHRQVRHRVARRDG